MAEKPTITIDGHRIDLAPLDSYTMDDAMVLWAYTEMTLDQVAETDGFVPGVVAALIHVSIGRAYPKMQEKQIRKQVGAIPLTDLAAIFEDISVEVDEQVPPPSALEPTSADATTAAASGPTSGGGGELSLVNNQDPGSGQRGSLTSLADFARVTSANSPPDKLTAFSS